MHLDHVFGPKVEAWWVHLTSVLQKWVSTILTNTSPILKVWARNIWKIPSHLLVAVFVSSVCLSLSFSFSLTSTMFALFQHFMNNKSFNYWATLQKALVLPHSTHEKTEDLPPDRVVQSLWFWTSHSTISLVSAASGFSWF
jgi:hypothetical protein